MKHHERRARTSAAQIYHIAHVNRLPSIAAGLEAPYGLELLAAMHWVMSREGTTRNVSVERHVYDKNARKRQFTSRQLATAEERLRSQGRLSQEVAQAHRGFIRECRK